MRTTDEFVAEAKRRAAVILNKRLKKRNRIFTACALTFCAALTAWLSFAFSQIELTPAADANHPAAATVMADSAIGGYVLLGVVCFALGAAATLFCQWARKNAEYKMQNAELNSECKTILH